MTTTAYEAAWYARLGSMFPKYPTGFDCDCMPESGPVERLVIYLCKYVNAPPISIRRIENYEGQNVTYRYEDHRKGEIRCPACGSTNMLLIRIWTKTKGVVYEWGGGLSACIAPVTHCPAVSLSPIYRQLTLAI